MNYFDALDDFKKLCGNQQIQCAVACRVYMDLMTNEKYCSVNKFYDSSLEVFYLKAETSDKSEFIIIPTLITKELDLNTIHKLRSTEEESSFLLALCDTSSNILYYRQFED